ncbi:Retrovirus-related Pol polyprotein from transposon TNT 1-94 [Cucumis melo var. makuwa]|uniref:Retrovirus-related Pol polyprotein from transposon TNT 1-94 n=1 Tax=Cucumis melo var. makuwa TaxID=1194695 RepID=A0A5D3DHU5_CUCMM|nr:Retrovirus-related Pol polyprotein from transposon TNT 1-94 [Cucumis melo var. makuwa]
METTTKFEQQSYHGINQSAKGEEDKEIQGKACLFTVVSSTIFTRIMTLRSVYEIWNYLKLELLDIASQIRLLGSEFKDSRIVEKILVSVPEKFEASIFALENTKHLTYITLADILNALQAHEQRRTMRQEDTVKGALLAKHYENVRNNKKKRLDAKCTKCKQMGHEVVICRSKNQQQGVEAKIVDQKEEEDQLFVATCFVDGELNESWLIDSGCTNHMTHDEELFGDLKPTNITKVKIGNEDYILVKGKGTVAIASCTEEEQSIFALKEDVTQLWHKRVGHYHHQGLLQLKELALDIPKLNEVISSSKACHFGKQNRKSFPKSSWRATQKLQLIHTDVAGPQRTPSLKGNLDG